MYYLPYSLKYMNFMDLFFIYYFIYFNETTKFSDVFLSCNMLHNQEILRIICKKNTIEIKHYCLKF